MASRLLQSCQLMETKIRLIFFLECNQNVKIYLLIYTEDKFYKGQTWGHYTCFGNFSLLNHHQLYTTSIWCILADTDFKSPFKKFINAESFLFMSSRRYTAHADAAVSGCEIWASSLSQHGVRFNCRSHPAGIIRLTQRLHVATDTHKKTEINLI